MDRRLQETTPVVGGLPASQVPQGAIIESRIVSEAYEVVPGASDTGAGVAQSFSGRGVERYSEPGLGGTGMGMPLGESGMGTGFGTPGMESGYGRTGMESGFGGTGMESGFGRTGMESGLGGTGMESGLGRTGMEGVEHMEREPGAKLTIYQQVESGFGTAVAPPVPPPAPMSTGAPLKTFIEPSGAAGVGTGMMGTGMESVTAGTLSNPLAMLASCDGVRIEQLPETIEPSGSTQRFHFNVSALSWSNSSVDPTPGRPLFYAVENAEFFTREIRDATTALELQVFTAETKQLAMVVARPRSTLTKYVRVYDANRDYLGRVKKALLGQRLVLQDPMKKDILSLKPPTKRWTTLSILRGSESVAVINKKTAGVGREQGPLPHADNTNIYDVLFPIGEDFRVRGLLIAATLFADLLWFEREEK